ncbi:MAG TPA: histone-like nucleoid-structuring protein, MvaT/MvaU family [Marinospirillum sp.]|uniref:histone-like nucleoid-structuring protein, MvaT/MvaU family n=1 Tax=Marinospirillum sp. TaxID=2183934 RepID=UPI002B4668F2|nr:histone-like nucleoid-structuring protein, MvaT/MvaU family [Marinospirillum sp.]HKM15435.1 histone-like nucleoid-structuring protein, MvaT/MvaU family [Marinospirillum sp.]
MSILASYREKEEMLRKLTEEMSRMEENPELKKELSFKEEVQVLLDKHQRSVNDLATIFGLNQSAVAAVKSGRGNRRTRKLKVYVNPNTQETIETRGGNHKELKEWKAEFGSDVVEGWVTEERE